MYLEEDEYITEIEEWGYFMSKLNKTEPDKLWENKLKKLSLVWLIFTTNKN